MILKFGTKLDSDDELYCLTKEQPHYCLSVPLFIHFSFSPMKISVADLSAPIGVSVFKFFVYTFRYIFFCQRFLSNYLSYDSEIWYKA